jgi:dTDP-4-dehydrorhamnose reductase
MIPVKALVLGCRGQLGHDVLAAANIADHVDARGLDRARLDLRDVDSMDELLSGVPFDVLINCAAYTQVDAAENDAAAAFSVNAYAVEALAACCARTRAMFIHVSTDYVFDGETDRPYLPDDAPAPLSVYGASKLVGEALARRAYPEGTVIVRTSSVFGVAGARPGGGGNFVETMIRLARERGRLSVVADNMMAPTFSADLARGLVDLVRIRPEPGIYHLTNEGQTSWQVLAAATLQLAGIPADITPITAADYPTPARRPRFSVLDTRSATQLTGRMPAWQDALHRYLALRAGDRVPPTNPLQ